MNKLARSTLERGFMYIGQMSEYHCKNNVGCLITNVSCVNNGLSEFYSVSTRVPSKKGLEMGLGGAITVYLTRVLRHVVNLIENNPDKKRIINWDNGLKAHMYVVEELKNGRKVTDESLAEQLWGRRT
ncbi:hypothetical protein J4461_01895 [Candidatus Pacearchaeota archaeon]|nr:hypothetical protein [Candidatus Pacearchaeota archaeon]